jgi:hypothetical protein
LAIWPFDHLDFAIWSSRDLAILNLTARANQECKSVFNRVYLWLFWFFGLFGNSVNDQMAK